MAELFSITCTTCKSRLTVRDQAAVGQILACPKCGGMVMIKPPPVWDESSEQKSDLPTATEIVGAAVPFNQTLDSSAFDVVDELLSDSPPKVQPPPSFTPSPAPAASVTPKPRFIGGPPAHRSPAPSPVAAAKAPASPAPSVADDSDLLPPPPPAEAAAPPSRGGPRLTTAPYWTFMVASVVLGILLAFAAVTGAIYLLGPVKLPTNLATAPVDLPRDPNDSPTESASPDRAPSSTSPLEASSASPQLPTKSNAAATEPSAVAAANATPQTDPLVIAKTSPAVAAPLGDPLGKFERLIGGAGDDPLAKTETPAAKPVPASADSAPVKPIAPRPPPREVDVAKRLADPIPAIQTAGTPLVDFLQLMSDLSTIPITLDLPLAPVTPETAVAFQSTNTTVGGALAQALVPLRLEYAVIDDQLIIRRIEPTSIMPVTHSVKDLTGGEEQQMTELAELLKAVVEPGVWDEAAGGSITTDAANGSLVIKQRRAVQFQVLLAIEKLRSARTPPLAHLLKLDSTLFALDTRWSRAKARLETSVAINYSNPTRLITVLNRLGEMAGMKIVVDWRDVASSGWNPAGEASVVAKHQPLADALDNLLTPLDLTWRAIDDQTLQVVTPTRLAEQCELEFYKVNDLIGRNERADELLARLRSALGETAFLGSGGNGELRYDSDVKCVLAWLPQPRQRELEALLAKWRGEK